MASALVQTSKGLGAPSNAIFFGYLLSILSFMLIAFAAYLWLSWSKSAGGMFSAFCEQVAKRWKVDENDTAEHHEDDTDVGEDVEEGQEEGDSQNLPLDASGAKSERKRLLTDDREVKHKKNVAASKNATSTTASVSDAEENHSTSSSSEEEVEYEDVEEATSPDERCAKKMKKGRGSKPFYATRVSSSTSSQKHEVADKLQTNRGLLAQMKGMKVQANPSGAGAGATVEGVMAMATTSKSSAATTTALAFDRKYLPFKLQNYMEESPFGP
eukprot:g1328.t1